MTAPDLTPQGTPWRTTAPDPAESRWWWVDRPGVGRPETVSAIGIGYYPSWDDRWWRLELWPRGWRCAPVATGEYERGRREGLERAARLAWVVVDGNEANAADYEAAGVDGSNSRAAARGARLVMEAIDRAFAPHSDPSG